MRRPSRNQTLTAPSPWEVAAAVLLTSTPASANNGPMPDAWLGLIALAPLGLLVFRLSGATILPEERRWRVTRILTLTFALLVAGAGTALATPACILAPAISIRWASRAMSRGSSRSRWLLGPLLILFSLFAPVAFVMSTAYVPQVRRNESQARSTLQRLATCQKTSLSEQGKALSLKELADFCGLESPVASGQTGGYRYAVEVSAPKDGAPASFIATAVPVRYGPRPPPLFFVRMFTRATEPTGERSFFVDGSGTVRSKDNGGRPPAGAAEGAGWE